MTAPYDLVAIAERDHQTDASEQESRSALADALAAVGDRWTLLLIAALLDGPRRFGELQEEVEGIAPNVLTQRSAPARAQRARRRPALLRAPAAVRLRAERRRPRARRRAAAAGRLGRPERRGCGRAAPRGVRDADGGPVVVPDVRAAGVRRRGRGAPLRLKARWRSGACRDCDGGGVQRANTGARSEPWRTEHTSRAQRASPRHPPRDWRVRHHRGPPAPPPLTAGAGETE